ncbi:MAG: glycosyltransferase family 4 protein, partial [Nakamurella sp.]
RRSAVGLANRWKGFGAPPVRRTLLITNDFPPRSGGIQSYVQSLAERLPAGELVVYAPGWDGAAEYDAGQPFPVYRHPKSLMLPGREVRRRAIELVREHRLEAVWYGAAAPLGLLTPALRPAGVVRAVASTHGHEVGWSMVPGARAALRRIGRSNDVITFVSQFARRRISAALGPAAALEYLPPGVRVDTFRPDANARRAVRERYGVAAQAPLLLSVSRLVARKGQDNLIRAVPAIVSLVPDLRVLIVGDGPDAARLRGLAGSLGLADRVIFAGQVGWSDLPAHYAAADVFAMLCRTRGSGLDVEGLGIVFLEASASGLPVIAGRSGGAPETVQEGRTGVVVDGRDIESVALAAADLLNCPDRASSWGANGRTWVSANWNWDRSATRLAELLAG